MAKKTPVGCFAFCWFLLQLFLAQFSHGDDTITRGKSMRDGDSVTLVSSNQLFELVFFGPQNSNLRYLGIKYFNIEPETIVWVANRDRPISDGTGVLTIGNDGNLVLFDGRNSTVWSPTVTNSESNNTVAKLMGTGNLVLSSANNVDDLDKALWQSFNNPTDTFLPGMKVRANPEMVINRAFLSWKSASDPSPGNFTLGLDTDGAPQIVIWKGQTRRWRSGQWNSAIFTGIPSMTSLTNFRFGFKLSPPEADGSMFFTYVPADSSDLLRFRILWDGREEQLRWDKENKKWFLMQEQPANECEFYNHCGNFGVCDFEASESKRCSCLQGYRPKFPDQWNARNWSAGCERKTPFQCQRNGSIAGGEDGFRGLKSLKMPDFETVVQLQRSQTCREMCLMNCSCNAYADISGIGCMIWTKDLIDLQVFSKGGSLLQLRLPDSELGGEKRVSKIVIIISAVVGTLLLGIAIWLLWSFKNKLKVSAAISSISCCKKNETPVFDVNRSREFSTDLSGSTDLVIESNQLNGQELPVFNFNSVASATNKFSDENKLGQGGFGPVYKGMLPGGEDIAVKRLSGRSGQGLEEFKNEIILIGKLQHRNLVRLLGYCIQGNERMLLYEYMPNRSLDFYIFDEAKQAQLDWPKRFKIIEGIARGLLYLHRDSRLRIIHRDLKASNILLDADMSPKISDFGLARIFGGNQNEANTVRVVGTYGYMSPEYAMEGLFSVKSDVYSFGVLLLEIISGKRNTGFRSVDHSSLIGYSWHHWNQGKAMELIDPSISNSISQREVLKCIHVGMLCVQDNALNRPNMAAVVLMLESESPALPAPKQPTYTSMRSSIDAEFILQGQDTVSSNDITVTMVVGR